MCHLSRCSASYKPYSRHHPKFLKVVQQYRSGIGPFGLRKCVYFEGRWPKGYSLTGPVEGLSGPRQYRFAASTGTSSRKSRRIFNCPSINWTSTRIPREALSSNHQYEPGFVGGPGSISSRENGRGCCVSLGGIMSLNGRSSTRRVSNRRVSA